MEWSSNVLLALMVLALLAVLSDRQQETTRRYEAIEKKLDRIAAELDVEEDEGDG